MGPTAALSIVSLLAGFAAARNCANLTIPVSISARQGLFKDVPFEGNLDATTFSQNFNNIGQNYSQVLLQGYQTLTGNYKIAAQFCVPEAGSKTSTIQLLSHGIGFDKTYWDVPFNNYNYSYTDVALKKGYATLAIDRFGIGNSSHDDPINVVQAQAEVEVLNTITTMLRNKKVPGITGSYTKVIHVGHSFGSIQSYWLSALYPNNTDGLVLTGFSVNPAFLPATIAAWNLHIARLNQPLRFGNTSNGRGIDISAPYRSGKVVGAVQGFLNKVGVKLSSQDIWNEIATTEVANLIEGYNHSVTSYNYPSGYLAWSDFTSQQYTFLLPGYYDLSLGLYAESTKQPVTAGELLTIGSSPSSSPFTGPVLVVTGQQDAAFCGGDCYANTKGAASIPAAAAAAFPKTSKFEAYIQPNTAHGINFHYNATGAYNVIQSWLGVHGLAA
ncbi:Alpha/Beta hydrolase protein [Clohesyomyces aquaticus]|uniref:Alpha/Beta hydrolase protein n=1 Tax=Clohesyomyces aquaticus TaxID=1231657 RepID=A0A1Y1Z317_9PLEO|nr:Alpha/Beta hydrolase protein [Clohesyomyces aquaticus]